ncbi:MAG: glycine cleavage system protein R [Phycisphaeraceae bacterium]
MQASFVLTIIGPDRRGLVESLAQTITAHDGNWVESRMAHLAGQFAGLLWITVPSERAAALEDALRALANDELHITIQHGEKAAPPEPQQTLRFQVIGHDRPGIVRDLARALRQRDVNVEELTSDSYSAPMSGEPLFKANIELGIPAGADMNELHQAIAKLADDLALDLTYEQTSAEG